MRPMKSLIVKRYISTPKALRDFKSNLEIHQQSTREKRDLVLTILKSAASKREARSYIQKYPLLRQEGHKYDEFLRGIASIPQEITHRQPHLSDTLRLGIIKVKDVKKMEPDTLQGIGSTIHKLVTLGLSPIIVLDTDANLHDSFSKISNSILEQTNLLIEKWESVDMGEPLSLRLVQGIFEEGMLKLPELLLAPLAQGIIPVVSPVTVLSDQKQQFVKSNEVVKVLARQLSELNESYKASHATSLLSIEKIIFIDPVGGIPSLERFKSAHVYINLLQEYDDIVAELYVGFLKPAFRDQHLENLNDFNEILTAIPQATGIITTPEIAVLKLEETNPLIYNVLTDRPTISFSLPVNLKKTPLLNTTVLKKGMSLTKFVAEDEGEHGIDLAEYGRRGLIDLTKLVTLIEDSFNRKLDLDHYLRRVGNNVAAVIVAGDYEGGAVITWEKYGGRRVAYLDKFAVVRAKQGTPGVADVVFKSMLATFENELLWRSRLDNPVNKYYFDRSKGNFKVLEEKPFWRGFYSGNKLRTKADFEAYNEICKSIEPSWR